MLKSPDWEVFASGVETSLWDAGYHADSGPSRGEPYLPAFAPN